MLIIGSLLTGLLQAQIAFDSASNYISWIDGSNGGFGFEPWSIVATGGLEGFAGAFIGNPADAGITNMANPSFGLFANPGGSGATVDARRGFAPLAVGFSLQFEWGVNWDSDTGVKGFTLSSGPDPLIGISQEGFPGDIFVSDGNTSTNTGIGYGTDPMIWRFTHITPGNVLVEATGRDGNPAVVFSQTYTVAGLPDAITFSASGMSPGDNRQPYFNNLQIIPEPGTALLLIGGLGLLAACRRRQG